MRGAPLVQSPLLAYISSYKIQSEIYNRFDITICIPVIILILIFIIWFAGWFDWKLGLLAWEQKFAYDNNPEWVNRNE